MCGPELLLCDMLYCCSHLGFSKMPEMEFNQGRKSPPFGQQVECVTRWRERNGFNIKLITRRSLENILVISSVNALWPQVGSRTTWENWTETLKVTWSFSFNRNNLSEQGWLLLPYVRIFILHILHISKIFVAYACAFDKQVQNICTQLFNTEVINKKKMETKRCWRKLCNNSCYKREGFATGAAIL